MRGRASILRLLGNRRVVVGLGAIVAVAAALYAIRGLPRHSGPPAANAAAQVLLDTNASQLANSRSNGVITLPMRATLVADLMASDQMRSRVAREAHLLPSQLDVLTPSSVAAPAFPTPLVTKASPFASSATRPYVVSLLTNEQTTLETRPPLITIETQAPDVAAATTLADAAINVLRSVFPAQAAGQPSGFVFRVVVPPRRILVAHRSRRVVYALLGAVMIFVCWYGATALGARVARRLRRPQLA